MKRIIVKHLFPVLLVFICTAIYAQKNPFDKFADSENLKYVYVSKQMIGLVKDLPLPNNINMSINNYHNIDELCSIQIISSGKGSIGELKSEAWSIIKKENFQPLLQANSAGFKTHIYCKDDKKKCVVVIIDETKVEMTVCVFTYDCQLKDLHIQTTTTKCNSHQ